MHICANHNSKIGERAEELCWRLPA
jgi:hypothetical protein